MSYIKDLQSNPDPQTFPGAKFEVAGTPPKAQCTEAKIEGDNADTENDPTFRLTDFANFTGYNLIGKVCHITASVGGNTGDFDITDNDDNSLTLLQDPGEGDPVTYHITNGAALELTRNAQSFADFIHAAGYAYTFKGGKLYTDIPSGQLQPACTITWDPIT